MWTKFRLSRNPNIIQRVNKLKRNIKKAEWNEQQF